MWRLSKRLINWLIPQGQRTWRDIYRLLSQSAETNRQVEALRHDVARLALELSQTKAGVSAIQAQSGEASSHIVVLRRELSEMTARLNEVASSLEQAQRRDPRRNAAHYDLSTLPGRLDLAASNHLKKASDLRADAGEEQRGLAAYYARMADLVSGYWIRRLASPQDLFPTDDFSIEFARQIGIDVPEAYADKAHPSSVPWRHLWFDPDCGILLVLGQSTAVNDSGPSGLSSAVSLLAMAYSIEF